jgi:thiol:disulfide interchange protein
MALMEQSKEKLVVVDFTASWWVSCASWWWFFFIECVVNLGVSCSGERLMSVDKSLRDAEGICLMMGEQLRLVCIRQAFVVSSVGDEWYCDDGDGYGRFRGWVFNSIDSSFMVLPTF